ncbi:MAG: histidine kinase dimerization/phospho-acceptor domain-containing protein [Lachnospiraceae bacterium]|nr:histidine kinase dimerization/phospho-acceptor domain-containing protein [Lachnospiraceae bacterium]
MLHNQTENLLTESNLLAAQTCATLFRLLSHELRNPISNMITSSNFYLEEGAELTDDYKTTLMQSISADASQLLSQVENIFSLSRLAPGPLQLSEDEIDAVISNAVRRTRSQYPSLEIIISSNLDSLLFPMDSALFECAIMLILKMIHEQIPDAISIQCTETRHADKVLLTFRTTCDSAVSPDTLPREKSFDLDTCQLIIQAHQGCLRVTPIDNALVYEIELPVKEEN